MLVALENNLLQLASFDASLSLGPANCQLGSFRNFLFADAFLVPGDAGGLVGFSKRRRYSENIFRHLASFRGE
jgi:hypothetical protein